MGPARIVLGVLMACGFAASAQDPAATRPGGSDPLLRESTSSKSSPGHRLTPWIVSGHSLSFPWA